MHTEPTSAPGTVSRARPPSLTRQCGGSSRRDTGGDRSSRIPRRDNGQERLIPGNGEPFAMGHPPPGRRDRDTLTLKLCLAGDAGVGKTSLIRRFVTDTFDESYISTLGDKASSRSFSFESLRTTIATIA